MIEVQYIDTRTVRWCEVYNTIYNAAFLYSTVNIQRVNPQPEPDLRRCGLGHALPRGWRQSLHHGPGEEIDGIDQYIYWLLYFILSLIKIQVFQNVKTQKPTLL